MILRNRYGLLIRGKKGDVSPVAARQMIMSTVSFSPEKPGVSSVGIVQ